jgi:hypothetical protein
VKLITRIQGGGEVKLPTLTAFVNIADLLPEPRKPKTKGVSDLSRIERAEQKRERRNKRRMK